MEQPTVEIPGTTLIEKEFQMSTEQREPARTINTEKIESTDFEEIKTPEAPPAATTKEQLTDPPPPKKPKMNAGDSAEWTVDAIDASFTLSFGLVNRKKMRKFFGSRFREVRDLYKDVREGRIKQADLADDKLSDYRAMKLFMEVDSEIPLDDEEYEKLVKNFKRYFETRPDFDIPPGMALMITGFPIFLKRLASAFDKP